MKLRRTEDNEFLEAVIKKLIDTDFTLLKNSKKFRFDWFLERRSNVYKIALVSDLNEILGLIMITDDAEYQRVHIDLLESSIDNQGSNKLIDNIAGCLISFAVSLSFKLGYSGYVTLEPKNELIEIYKSKYGFEEVGYMMMTRMPNSQILVDKYLDYDEE